jgi:hypothetical protein
MSLPSSIIFRIFKIVTCFLVESDADYKRKIGHFVNELKTHMVDSIRKAGDDLLCCTVLL